MFTSNTICVLLGCGQGQPFSAKQMFLSESCDQNVEEKERGTQNVQGWFFPALNCCRRVWFVRSVPADTFYPHRPPDSLMTGCVYAKSYSLSWSCQIMWADNGSYVMSNFISHYCILTRGVCLAFSKNEWHIKTCCNLTTQKKRHKTTSQEVLVEVSLRFNECRQKLLHHKDKKINIRLQHNWLTCSFTTMIKTAQVHYGNFLALVSKFACFGTFFLFQAILWGKCKGKQSVTKWTHTHISPPLPAGSRPAHFNHHCQEHCNYQDPH